MDNLDKNKVGESFENNLPDDQLPEFIWDNLKTELDKGIVEPNAESTESIKESFEDGFNKEALPVFLWDDISGELDATSTLDTDLTTTNKIKSSFEGKYHDAMPEDLWNNVENQLEIETAWQQVRKALNRRTKLRYWQEKGMQFGIAALAILWLRGCGVGEYITTPNTSNPSTLAHQQSIESAEAKPNQFVANKKQAEWVNKKTSTNSAEKFLQEASTKNSSEQDLLKSSQETKAAWVETVRENKTEEQNVLVANTPVETEIAPNISPVLTALSVIKKTNKTDRNKKSNNQENTDYVVTGEAPSLFEFSTLYSTKESDNKTANPTLETTQEGSSNTSNAIASNLNQEDSQDIKTMTKVPNKGTTLNSNTATSILQEEHFVRKNYAQTMLPMLASLPIKDSTIYTAREFEIKNVTMKKSNKMRFELGLVGKVGTALLLGNAMDKAMETTSMVKTEIRPSAAVGLQANAQLTKNDAVVFAAYPFSVSSQYFGGYTSGGRFYNKEIKLEYFDFSLGYQRTLFHYNDFGSVPSTMYVRLEYGLGYLNKSEEYVNGELANEGTLYKKINHSIGLAIGSTHQIKRFIVDYGIHANMGMTSISNSNPLAAPVMDQTNLMQVGGYLGLRYIL